MAKILFISTSTTVGGAEKTLYTLATLIDPHQFQVAGVVSLKPKGPYAEKLEAMGHKVYTLGLNGTPGLADIKKLADIVRQTKPDLVHAIMYQGIQMARALKLFGYARFKLVSAPRVNYRTRGGFSLWIDGVLKGVDNVLVTESNASRQYLTEKLDYPEDKVLTIYNGVDIASWPISKVERNKLRMHLRVGREDILLGCVGRLDEQKGHAYLLEAVAKLHTAHPVKLLVIGEGPLRETLEGLAKQLRVDEHVTFVGEQKDIPNWLSATDIFVQSSLWEGLPNALLEAMAMALPCVATSVDGVPEVILHGHTGLIAAPKDSQALFVQIQDLIMDPELRRKLGQEAKRAINDRFRLMDMIGNYEKLYARLTGA